MLIEGVDQTITKTATITQLSGCEDVRVSSRVISTMQMNFYTVL